MAYTALGNKNIRICFGLFWLITFIAVQVILQSIFNLPAATAFTDNFITIVLTLLSISFINRWDFIERIDGYQVIPFFVISAIVSVACLVADYYSLHFFIGNNSHYDNFLYHSLPCRGISIWFVVSLFTFTNFLWHKSRQRNVLDTRNDDLQKMAKEAELNKIYKQFQPHFIFNSLNSIQALIRTQPEKAEEMLQDLSQFLRGSLKRDNETQILFKDEIHHLSLYLELEKIRFGERLQTALKIDKQAEEAIIPPLILQPLIENAIKFGLYGTIGNVEIECKAEIKDNNLEISIVNPYDEDAQPPKGTGYGLKSVSRRLYLIFGRQDLLQTRYENAIFTVQLIIPQ